MPPAEMEPSNASVEAIQTDIQRWLLMNCTLPQPVDATGVRNTVMIIYTAGFFFGLAGNSLVIGIISYYKTIRIKSVANYYIWNLSLADLFYVLVLPFYVYNTYTQDWPFGEVACKVVSAFMETNHFSSVFLLVALSWDRYIASFYNLSHLRTIKLGTVICIIIWLICAVISTPHWLYARVDHNPTDNATQCHFSMPKAGAVDYEKLWTLFNLVFGFLVPFVMITLAYFLLSARLKKMTRGCATSGVKKPSKKMTKTVAVVVTTFLVCQTPTYAIFTSQIIQELLIVEGECPSLSTFQVHVQLYVNSIAKILVFISSCINPIIYGIMNENYRELYRVVLCRCQRTAGSSNGKVVNVPVERTPTAGSGSESESQDTAVAEVTYRFQVHFHNPCTGKKKKKHRSQHGSKRKSETIMLEEHPPPAQV